MKKKTIQEQLNSINNVIHKGPKKPVEKLLPFGKFKGSSFDEVARCEPDYLKMLLKPNDFKLFPWVTKEIERALSQAGHSGDK